ncbi:MAG: PD-(D/E)XK nuclease-like domain-containing protein [Burkholderiales bacterium]
MNAPTLPVGIYGMQGIVPVMPNGAYHARHAVSASGLKALSKSPRHYWAAHLDPNREPKEPTPAMKAGTLAHCMILEPESFQARYVIRPDGLDMRTKAGKAWSEGAPSWADIISQSEHRAASLQSQAVRALPEVSALLAKGQPEVSAFWVDQTTGSACKCRPDWVSPAGAGVVLVDIKTCPDASPKGFARAVANFRYDLQAAWYSHGYEHASGLPVLGFVFAAVEHDYPHAAAAYMLDDDTLAKARAECDRLLALHRQCTDTGNWPGYPEHIQLLTLPAWANKD